MPTNPITKPTTQPITQRRAGSKPPPASRDGADTGATNMGATNVGATNVGATNVGASNVGATNVGPTNVGATNMVWLRGRLSSAPREQSLPSGTVLVSWEVTTVVDTARQSVPVVWFDPPAGLRSIRAGDDVVVIGSVRRRFYRAGGRTVSRTEVVGSQAVAAGMARQRRRLRDTVVAQLTRDE